MPVWQVANVAWSDRERFTLVYQDADIQVYRNDAALPRAYLVPEAVRAPAALHVKEMAERSFDPMRMLLIDPAAESAGARSGSSGPGVALEGPSEPLGAGRWPTLTPDAPGEPVQVTVDALGRTSRSPAGTTAITRYTGEQVVARVDAASDAWLFLADTYDPSWHAYVDGAARPVRLANAMFRAVAVPAGHHTVEFRFEPASLQRGAAISLATGALLLVVLGGSLTWSVVQRWQACA
jgi:hypothetical protein